MAEYGLLHLFAKQENALKVFRWFKSNRFRRNWKMAKKKQKRKKKATFNFVKLTKKQVEDNRSKAYKYVM